MDLRDLRAKVTVEADAALDAVAQVTGKDRAEIVREVMHEWATRQIDVARLLLRRLTVEGLPGSGDGAKGSG